MAVLDEWIEGQYRHCAQQLLGCISCGIVKDRPGFGQSVRAVAGSVVASAVLGSYDPDPDYFFHWYRDAAVVIDALRLLHLDGLANGRPLQRFAEFLDFSLNAQALDGRTLVREPQWRAQVQPDFQKFLRTEAELSQLHGARIRGETRLNADGSLDISSWPRPQHDGIATRALALQRWLREVPLAPALRMAAEQLLAGDLEHTRAHWREPGYDIWEEELGLHYYTLLASATALAGRADEDEILRKLDGYWQPEAGFYRSRVLADQSASIRDPDISVILAAIHCNRSGATHSMSDPRLHATLAQLESVFARCFEINQRLPAAAAPALGRYERDIYYGGGAWYVATLAAAEFCYLAAGCCPDAPAWLRRGDAFLTTVRHFTPATGDLSEQFDRSTGEQKSARHLGWSYAAFISCIAARRTLLERI